MTTQEAFAILTAVASERCAQLVQSGMQFSAQTTQNAANQALETLKAALAPKE